MADIKFTERELTIITFVSDGLPNKAIASKLSLSIKTIINQRAKIYGKLEVHCTADLIRKAIKLKLITIDDKQQ